MRWILLWCCPKSAIWSAGSWPPDNLSSATRDPQYVNASAGLGCTSRGPRGRSVNVPRFCLCLSLPAGQLPGLDTEKASPGKSLWNNQEDGVTDFTWWGVTIRLMGRWYFSLPWSHRSESVPDFLWPQQGVAPGTHAGGSYEAQRLGLLEIGGRWYFCWLFCEVSWKVWGMALSQSNHWETLKLPSLLRLNLCHSLLSGTWSAGWSEEDSSGLHEQNTLYFRELWWQYLVICRIHYNQLQIWVIITGRKHID